MNLRNIIEIIVLLSSIAILLPLYIIKKKEVEDLDGFDIAQKDESQEEEDILKIE